MLIHNCWFIDINEIRTILGSCQDVEGYQEGDDLCENLYRACIGAPLRFGHKTVTVVENYCPDATLIKKITNMTYMNYKLYKN